jgi:hypothetical protein
MALSRDTAGKIIAIVAADADTCRRIGKPVSSEDLLHDPTMVSIFKKRLEELGAAGGFRNATLMFLMSTDELNEINCAGIAAASVKPLVAAIAAGKLPEVKKAGANYRETGVFKVGHYATWISMSDGSEYMFDWHATLNPNNPAISTPALWSTGASGINYVNFKGM